MSVNLTELFWLVLLGVSSGTVGAIAGIGGGVIIVPALVIIFGFDFPTAVAASLAAVVATSTAAGSAYVRAGLTNMRLAITLEVATTLGGISGGFLGVFLPERVLSGVFAGAMATTSVLVARSPTEHKPAPSPETERRIAAGDEAVRRGVLDARYWDPDADLRVTYHVRRIPFGLGGSYVAGIVSGLLGVGAGIVKVPTMNLVMGVPIKVAAATSNFMIGVTAVSSLFVYLGRGEVHPAITSPLVLGTVVGALIGTFLQPKIPSREVRLTLTIVLIFVAAQMGLRAMGIRLG